MLISRLAALLAMSLMAIYSPAWSAEPIRVGILHSLTGTMAISEKPVADITLLAIERINASGGLLGRQILPIMADGKSDEKVFATEAERLIGEEHVDVLFGCWTSASRKAVKPIVERMQSLLFYPVQYEGLEESRHIIYSGAAPNQQIIPAVSWAVKNLGSRVYLVGSDYVFPRVANWLIGRQLPLVNARLVGEAYVRLGDTDMSEIIADIRQQHPDVIFNTINGDSNIAFFHALKQAGLTSADTPVMSFSLAEAGIRRMPAGELAGHYAAWNYFQSLKTERNREFIRIVRQRFGDIPVSDPMEAAWIGVQMWASAVRSARSSDAKVIHHAILQQSLDAPEGIVAVDRSTHHLWKTAYIGRINARRQFDIVWSSGRPLRPFPYPQFINRFESEKLLHRLFDSWGGQWSASGKTPPQQATGLKR